MATVISMINLKGGVAKTTTTMAVAEMLSGAFNKKVLVIDLDPQTNATVALIGDERWGELNKKGHTLAQLFKDALEPPEARQFDIRKSIVRSHRVSDARTVWLLPSSLDLIEVQDRLATMPSGKFYAENPTDILRRAVRPVIDEYDFVLVDCPPNLGIITLNGLRISHAYVIPTIPDYLSTYGIPQIVTRVREFSSTIGEEIVPLGVVATKYRSQSTVHRSQLRVLRNSDPRLFDTIIPEATKLAEAADSTATSTLRQKWGYGDGGGYESYLQLTKEILQRLEG